MLRRILTIFMLLIFVSAPVWAAAEEGDDAAVHLPVPRFVTLGPDEVNLRTGPGMRYPIRFVIRKHGLPVEIVREFDVWRQIRDRDGSEGWVHKSMLSGKRSLIVTGAMQTMMKKPDEDEKPVAKVEPGVIAGLGTCTKKWCHASVGGYEGWLKRDAVWGVYPDETFGKE